MTKLREQMIQDMTLRGLAPNDLTARVSSMVGQGGEGAENERKQAVQVFDNAQVPGSEGGLSRNEKLSRS